LRLIEDDPLIWHYLSSSEIGELVPNAKTLGEEEIAKLRALTDEIRERTQGSFHETLARAIFAKAQEIAQTVVQFGYAQHRAPLDVRLDRILTSRTWGFLVMILLFGGVLWLTIIGSNYPSSLLSYILVDTLHPLLREFAIWAQFPWWLGGLLFDGVYFAVGFNDPSSTVYVSEQVCFEYAKHACERFMEIHPELEYRKFLTDIINNWKPLNG